MRLIEWAIGQDQGKLVTTDAGSEIGLTAAAANDVAHLAQESVPSGVPGPVIYRLEAIEVDKAERVLPIFRTSLIDRRFQLPLKRNPIR